MERDKVSQKINALKHLYEHEIKIHHFQYDYTNVSKSNYIYHNTSIYVIL